jgi:nucleoside-diphosphate-sugar epimerase
LAAAGVRTIVAVDVREEPVEERVVGVVYRALDVRDPGIVDLLREHAVDAVVHLAAVVGDPACGRDPENARAINLDATRALVQEAAAAGVGRFVFASTCSNYGKMEDADAFATEEWELRPVSLYAETKVAAELEVLAHTRPGFATTCLRFATVYGASPRMRFDLTVNEFARDALLDGKLVVYGEQFWRPYVHVRDAARAVVATLAAPVEAVGGEVFNVGSSQQNFRKQDLVAILVEQLPETEVERVLRTEDPRDYRVSFEKIESRLDFATARTVAEGVDEVIGLLRAGAIGDPFSDVFRN